MSARKGHGTVLCDLMKVKKRSEVTHGARAGMGGGEKKKEEKRGREADEEKMEEAGKGERRKGKGIRLKCQGS